MAIKNKEERAKAKYSKGATITTPKKPKTNSAERKKIKAEFDKAQEAIAAKTKMRKAARDKKKEELRAKKAANKAFSQQQFAELKSEIIANRNARKKGGSNPLKLKGLNTGGVV